MHLNRMVLLFGLVSILTLTPCGSLSAENRANEESTEVEGPKGTISGTVIDDTGLGMPGVLLKLDKYNRYTVTDLDGHFIFLAVPEGNYTLTASYIGYKDYTAAVSVKANRDTDTDVRMSADAVMIDEVVVFGQLTKGQARALNIEKNNSNITNLVAADQIGRFPDANIGDALKRIPGITIQTDQGEARNLVVRGLATALNSVTLDGGRIPSAEGDNRNIQLDLIPSEMIQVIEVNKTLLPDMEADAIGGSVNLKTKTAPERRLLNLNLGWGWNPIRNKPSYIAGVTYGDRFFDKKLGVALTLSFQDRIYGSDNVEGEWKKGGDGVADYLKEFEIRKYDVTRLRGSVSLNMDYEISRNSKLYFSSMYNYRNDYENRYAFQLKDMEPVDGQTGVFSGELRRAIKMGATSPENPSGRRHENQQIMHFMLGGDHLFASSLHFDWGGSFARALENKLHERTPGWRVKDAVINADYTDTRFPLFSSKNDVYDDFELKELVDQTDRTYEDEWSAFANFRLPLSVIRDQKGRLRFGAKVRFKGKNRDNVAYEAEPIEEGAFDLSRLDVGRVSFSGLIDGRYTPGQFPDARELGAQDWFDSTKFETTDLIDEYWVDNYTARENIYAAYLRWDQNLAENLLAILGARVEYTAVDYTGNTIEYNEDGDPSRGPVNEGDNGYLNVFPNLTLRYQPIDRVVLRAAYSTGIARPNYYDLVPYFSVNREDGELSLGNPELRSTYAHNFDLLLSYYSGAVSHLTAGGFYKHLNNFIFRQTLENVSAQQFGRMYPQFAGSVTDGDWDVYTRANGSAVDLFGFEVGFQQQLTFLPGFLKGFSLYANYTFVKSIAHGITNEDGEERKDMPLPGTAPHSLNVSLGYEHPYFRARLSLNHASSYLDELGSDAFSDVYYGNQTFLDFNADATLAKGLTLYLEANNLLNTPLWYYQGTSDHVKQQEYYKPSFTIGLKWSL